MKKVILTFFITALLSLCMLFTACTNADGADDTDVPPAPTPSTGVEYTISNDRTFVSVTGYTGTEADVVISAVYNDLPVTAISDHAFSGCPNITSVTIPDSITSIGIGAFQPSDSFTIKYCGSETQWNSISKEVNWDYGTNNYTIIYNYNGQ